MNKTTLDELRRLEALATKPPWEVRSDGMTIRAVVPDDAPERGERICIFPVAELGYFPTEEQFLGCLANLELIAVARNAMPELLAYVAELETQRDYAYTERAEVMDANKALCERIAELEAEVGRLKADKAATELRLIFLGAEIKEAKEMVAELVARTGVTGEGEAVAR